MAVVTKEAQHRVGLLDGEALILLGSRLVTQIHNRKQHQRIVIHGLEFAIHLDPFCRKADILFEVADIMLAVSSVAQLCHEVIKFHARVAFFISFRVDNRYFHFFNWIKCMQSY